MKFSDMPYRRPDIDALRADYDRLLAAFPTADAAAQIALFDEHESLYRDYATCATLAQIRHTVNTADEFYSAENDFFDENGPLISEKVNALYRAMLASPHRAALEEHYGKLLFDNLEIAARCFSPAIVELSQEENRLASQYQKLYASATVTFDGKTMTLPELGVYKTSTDRAVRRAAFETEGRFFDEYADELDDLYDRLVHCRDEQAKALGYDNYVAMGYDCLGRNCYTPADMETFRTRVAADIVPVIADVKERQRQRLGVDALKLYDDAMDFPDGNAKPQGTADDILAAGRDMYRALSPETAEFIDFLYDNELFDVLSRPGKAPGGYCTDLPAYGAPFIFSNFNGTSADVDVLTHEAGHAFAFYRAARRHPLVELASPTIEACEVHSMSMEFLTAAHHHRFFGDQTDKYELAHAEDALCFLPYGCMVDEFQTRCYEQPDLTPAARHELWRSLEQRYRPYIDYDALPFYSRGAGWQRQLHIYLYPLYYIDYCLAQTVAFQFWMAFLHKPQETWQRYLTFVDLGGERSFAELVRAAGLRVPYEGDCLREVGEQVGAWLAAHS